MDLSGWLGRGGERGELSGLGIYFQDKSCMGLRCGMFVVCWVVLGGLCLVFGLDEQIIWFILNLYICCKILLVLFDVDRGVS